MGTSQTQPGKQIPVLDHGYVRLVTYTPWNAVDLAEAVQQGDLERAQALLSGHDLAAVNAARASFAKEKDELSPGDLRLLRFLGEAEPVPHSCYDADTEVFTARGWVRWPEVTVEDRLAAVTPSGTMEFEEPTTLYRAPYKGKMYVAEQAHVDMKVTPNHRLFVARRTNGGFHPFGVQTAEEIVGKAYRVRTTAVLPGGEGGTYAEGFLYGFFLGLGDGYRPERGNRVSFHLKKRRKIAALLEAVTEAGLEHSVTVGTDTTEIRVDAPQPWFSGKSKDKRIDSHVFSGSLEYRRGVFAGLLASDGSRKRSSFTFASASEGLVEDLIRLGTTIGEYVKRNRTQRAGTPEASYKAMILSRCLSPRLNDSGTTNDRWEDYDGEVYCAEVSTGMLLVRRNGKIVVSGNSPFRHNHVTLEVYAPLFVCRQWWRHAVGAATMEEGTPWSELSRRYVRGKIDYYLPGVYDWRATAADIKQGSAGALVDEREADARWATQMTRHLMDDVVVHYQRLIERGVAPEQARMILPQNVYTAFRWSPSVQALANFLVQRLDGHAQQEIQVYAEAVRTLVEPIFPHSVAAMLD
jgi:thymidylate synthase (FAD)